MRAFLFALDPTPAQEQAFRSHCGAQRFAFNFGVELAGKLRAQRAAEYSYGLRGAELTPCSAYDLRRAWNRAGWAPSTAQPHHGCPGGGVGP
jgi:putative transposase